MAISQISSGPPAPQPRISRRALMKGSAALALGAAVLPLAHGMAVEQPVAGTSSGPLRKGKVIDCHAHLNHRSRATWEADDRKLIEAADKLGIDQLCCSTLTPRKPATADGFQECNRWTAEGMRRFPGRVLGYCYVNPGYGREALEDVRRCIEDRGFIGIKLYNEYTCTEPVVFPIVELAIELNVPILHHASHSHYFVEDQPRMSDGGHLAELARRYPEAMLICAHISGGGDWEWTIKALRHAPNVLLDTSGSVTDEGTVEMAAGVVGANRVVFGCDFVHDGRGGQDSWGEPERTGQAEDPERKHDEAFAGAEIMIVDVNAYLGHFAFRRLRYNTAAPLLALMDSKRIDKAVVSSAGAITYRNAQAGNEEVAEEVRGHSDRLIPFAVINPFYAGWQDDLKICHEQFGMVGLRLYPKWHNYQLSSPCCRELVNAATERGMVISIPIRVEDNRQRSWLLNVPDVPLEEIVKLVKAHPKARFILLNGIGYTRCPLGRKDNGLPSNYAIELSRLSAVLANELGQLIANLGAERVMFGTGMPFNYPDPALVKLEVLDTSEPEKEKIRSQNAMTWLRL